MARIGEAVDRREVIRAGLGVELGAIARRLPGAMGTWSRLAGDAFLRWLAPAPGRRWVDVGCGNGAFTELLVERCAPSAVQGIDPSAEQIAFARARLPDGAARFDVGDAMALPYGDDAFDAAVMQTQRGFQRATNRLTWIE